MPRVEPTEVKASVLQAPEFAAFSSATGEIFAGWRRTHQERLRSLKVGDNAKELITIIAEDLLACFAAAPLIDKYDVYQHLMTYWALDHRPAGPALQ
jgi:type I restriction enzyme M protein